MKEEAGKSQRPDWSPFEGPTSQRISMTQYRDHVTYSLTHWHCRAYIYTLEHIFGLTYAYFES